MGKIIETMINRFDGGIVNDPRDPRENTARVVTNFDILANPNKMTPYRDSEDGDSAGSTSQKQNFAVAIRTAQTYSLYALGRQSALNRAEVLYKNLDTGGSNDLGDNTWTNTANNQAGQASPNYNLFVYFRRTGLIYGAHTGTHFFAYDPSGSAVFNDTSLVVTYTHVGQGHVHSKDNRLYVPYHNSAGSGGSRSFIARHDGSSWSATALTLPDHLIPTSVCEYGNFLAIGCADASGMGDSKVFLWNRDSTITTMSESVDWGSGSLVILHEVDGELIGISQQGGAASSFSGMPAGTISFGDRVIFRRLNGNKAERFMELRGGSNTTLLPAAKQKIDNRLYFMMSISLNGATREGVWSVGRSDYTQRFVLTHERTPSNDTALVSSAILYNFIKVGDYLFQSYASSGSIDVSKTNNSSSFNHTAIYESKVFNDGDSSIAKKLHGVSVMTEALPANGQVVVKYAIDDVIGDGSWTTILTHDTDGAVYDSAVNIESTGGALPEYREIQFRIEVTSGVSGTSPTEITGFSYKSEVKGKRAYE